MGLFFNLYHQSKKKLILPQANHIHLDIDNFNLHYVWQYFAVTTHADAKEGWDKNAICNFVTKAAVDEALQEQQHIF